MKKKRQQNREWHRLYYHRNREKLLKRVKEWQKRHKDSRRESQRMQYEKNIKNPPEIIIKFKHYYKLLSPITKER